MFLSLFADRLYFWFILKSTMYIRTVFMRLFNLVYYLHDSILPTLTLGFAVCWHQFLCRLIISCVGLKGFLKFRFPADFPSKLQPQNRNLLIFGERAVDVTTQRGRQSFKQQLLWDVKGRINNERGLWVPKTPSGPILKKTYDRRRHGESQLAGSETEAWEPMLTAYTVRLY